MDKFSGLPNEVICHIVSFLSAKEAAFTLVLSKRFQNLFTILPNLQFSDFPRNQGSVMGFLDGLLALPASSRIRKFSLECRYSNTIDPIHYAHINRCLCDVLKRGVLNLELSIHVREGYSLPFEVFTSKTVVVLKLGTGFVIDFLPENAFLPALETLFLSSVQFCDLRGCAFQMLLSACPVLKELNIDFVDWESWKWSRTISIPTFQRLIVKRSEYGDFDGSDLGSITFNTRSLVFLEYCDFVPDEYPLVNLDSLVEAKLGLIVTVDHGWPAGDVDADEDNITSDPTNLIKGLRNVKKLNLLSTETVQMFYVFHEAIPVFRSLYHLSFPTDDMGHCWRLMPFLLKKAPNLKTLVIECPLHYDGEQELEYACECSSKYYCLLSCHVEVLEIMEYRGTRGEVEQLKHFLAKLSCLELVKVRARARSDKLRLRIATNLLKLPRASSECTIQIEFV